MDDKMYDRLETILQRATYLEKMMELPAVIADFKRYTIFAKEKANLEEVVGVYKKYKEAVVREKEGKTLMKDVDDEISTMGKLEYDEAVLEQTHLEEEIKVLLIPKDPMDGKNAVVEIRGAAGGDEANLFAGDLFRMYTRYCELRGWKIEMMDVSESELGGFSLVSFLVTGKDVFSRLKYESGAHRVQRVPRTEASGRIHTSTATVVIMPEADDVDVQIKTDDLAIDTYRASGAGGQHINKTDSAIRITHIPTGIVVTCQEARSQHENRDRAMQMLRTKIYDEMNQRAEAERGSERKLKVGTGDRSEKIRTYNYPQNRVTDHRIGFTLQQLEKVIDGDLDLVINALINEDQRMKLMGESL